MIKCQTCGTENPGGSQYCDECGAKLIGNNNDVRADAPSFQSQYPETPIFRGANVTSIGIPAIVEEIKVEENFNQDTGSSKKGIHARLVIERGEAIGTEFTLSAEDSYLGRWDADNGVFPDVDLDAYDPEAKVSRRHARILRQNGKYLIEDLGSTNGTFVNRGRRLIPGSKQPLNDNDEVIVGKTFLRFYIND
ncbi:MAG TPA: FHA domain-containing protein [Pyrinomonadaceae bacterium]